MLLSILYIIGITAEAMTGALAAGRRQMDMFGVIIIASVTAIGGGSVRDMLLGHFPLGWVKHPEYIVIVAIAAIVTTWGPLMRHLRRLFLVLDAVGLIVFHHRRAGSPGYGAQRHYRRHRRGDHRRLRRVLRDMFCNRIPLVFQKEIYAGISFSAAWLYIGLQHLSLPHNLVVILTLVAGLSARLIALRFRLGLPVFNYQHPDH